MLRVAKLDSTLESSKMLWLLMMLTLLLSSTDVQAPTFQLIYTEKTVSSHNKLQATWRIQWGHLWVMSRLQRTQDRVWAATHILMQLRLSTSVMYQGKATSPRTRSNISLSQEAAESPRRMLHLLQRPLTSTTMGVWHIMTSWRLWDHAVHQDADAAEIASCLHSEIL